MRDIAGVTEAMNDETSCFKGHEDWKELGVGFSF